jgi:type I restriction-modification system DNA methylase subunit
MTIEQLVETFHANRSTFLNSAYNELQLRNDFLNPFLEVLGWDVDNVAGKNQFLRDVILEEAIEVEGEASKKKPDYTLRIQGQRKLFVEAKKPSIDISRSSRDAFQIRRYGWNANLGISILTNFDKLIIYDCRHKPDARDDERVARVKVFEYTDYVSSFEEIKGLISFEAVSAGRLDDLFSVYDRVGETFDDYFLFQIEKWRGKLAESAIQRNRELTGEDINFLIQRLLNRIIFLRICEDRTIEDPDTLKNITDYNQLKDLFRQSDLKYNSGLFNFIEDNLSLNVEIDAEVLIQIFSELYYPHSPYNFSVVDPAILSQIYEKFLGSRIVLDSHRQYSVFQEPEVAASSGVVPTPKIIVEQIVKETLSSVVDGKTAFQLGEVKIADICCGSGTFLISVFDFLLKTVVEKYREEGFNDPELINEISTGTYALTLKGKRVILENNIFGVDINPYAVEVTEFSLLLKLLEGESASSVNYFISHSSGQVLPSLNDNIKCGNSVVDKNFFSFLPEAIQDDDLLFRVKPFDWFEEFPFIEQRGGFDAIVGNPPYVRIQNLVKYAPEEVTYYQSTFSGYSVATKETIDKYYVFIQRAVGLLSSNGLLGYIIPNKFFIIKGGKALRKFIVENSFISKILHFGVTQVFPDRSTYTAILILQKESKEEFHFKRIRKITPQLLSSEGGFVNYKRNKYSDLPWVFLSPDTEAIFNKLKSVGTTPLKSVAEICVGLQTSNDKVYIFQPETEKETPTTFHFTKNGRSWDIEKDICMPCVYDLSFSAFDSIVPNAQMIFPYSITDGKAEVFPEAYFKENYPLCWEYMISNKSALEDRNLQGKTPKWYQFGRSQSLTRFHNIPKLIWTVLATKPTYVYDELDLQFTGGGNGPYYSMLPQSEYSLHYLLGILCHPLFERMVKAGASEFRGAYYSHGKQFIENLPIKTIDPDNEEELTRYNEIVKTVKDLIDSKKKFHLTYGSRKTVFERKINTLNGSLINLINDLYGITQEEFNKVINDEMFSTELIADEE